MSNIYRNEKSRSQWFHVKKSFHCISFTCFTIHSRIFQFVYTVLRKIPWKAASFRYCWAIMAFEQESILSCLTCFGTNLRSLWSNQKDTKVSIYVSLAKYSMAQFNPGFPRWSKYLWKSHHILEVYRQKERKIKLVKENLLFKKEKRDTHINTTFKYLC